MSTRRLTAWVILSAVVLLLGFDVFVGVEQTPNDTISEVVFDWGRRFLALPFALGMLVGHFFMPLRDPGRQWLWLAYAIIGPLIILAFDGIMNVGGHTPYPRFCPAVTALIAALYGGWFWPVKPVTKSNG